ncbi:DUF2007 domain-containing protein [Haliangium ochraceum]|uniref:DUF2007 domain-containing protein n=1 Tax=Haliangium ochraceum (strain DSM 14365 / JCM 11303 / SMP-2) TaxID=502025 RepID=D0LYH9_HALO1|nr:DUF2007 domain-containing protein [Haliangium ochraceum]ACY17845.1 hypothetical protein Hoch_5361 [Haliangium ochraceum DSM 14365]
MQEHFVIVHRSSDPIQTDMLGALLRENGIAARVMGTRHGAAIGVGQNILQVHISVPQSQAGAATDFLEAFFEEDGAELIEQYIQHSDFAGDEDDDEARERAARWGDEDEDEDEADAPSRAAPAGSHNATAALASLLFLGGAHFYTRRPITGAMLALGQLAALLLALTTCLPRASAHTPTWLIALSPLLLMDLVGGQLAARARRRGEVLSRMRQGVLGAVFLAAAGVLLALATAALPGFEDERALSGATPAPCAAL